MGWEHEQVRRMVIRMKAAAKSNERLQFPQVTGAGRAWTRLSDQTGPEQSRPDGTRSEATRGDPSRAERECGGPGPMRRNRRSVRRSGWGRMAQWWWVQTRGVGDAKERVLWWGGEGRGGTGMGWDGTETGLRGTGSAAWVNVHVGAQCEDNRHVGCYTGSIVSSSRRHWIAESSRQAGRHWIVESSRGTAQREAGHGDGRLDRWRAA